MSNSVIAGAVVLLMATHAAAVWITVGAMRRRTKSLQTALDESRARVKKSQRESFRQELRVEDLTKRLQYREADVKKLKKELSTAHRHIADLRVDLGRQLIKRRTIDEQK